MNNISLIWSVRRVTSVIVLSVFAFCADSVCLRPFLRHRPWANIQILLPETQSESHHLLPGRSVCGSDRLADYWSCSGDLWVLPLIQVSSKRNTTVSLSLLSWTSLHFWSQLIDALINRGFFPVAVGFIRRVPVLGVLLSLPGISSVSISSQSVIGHFCKI